MRKFDGLSRVACPHGGDKPAVRLSGALARRRHYGGIPNKLPGTAVAELASRGHCHREGQVRPSCTPSVSSEGGGWVQAIPSLTLTPDITQWKRGAATSRASTAHEKIAHLCLELEKQRENKLVLAKERKELQTLTQLLESERELKGARETEARAYTRILALLENTVQDVEALVTCSLAGLRRSSREELFGSHFATDNGPLLRQKGRSTNPFDDCEHGNDEPKAVAKMETIPEIQERSAELIRAPIKLESTTESDIGGNENLEEQIECMHIESSWVQPMPVPVDLSPQYPSSHHSMRSFFSPENFSALSSLSDEGKSNCVLPVKNDAADMECTTLHLLSTQRC